MKNLFFSVLMLGLFSFCVSAQTGSMTPQEYIEAYGTEIPAPFNYEEDFFTESTTWTSLANAPSFFGRATAGVIGNYLYIHTSQNATSLALAFHIPTGVWSTSTTCNFPSFNNAFTVANGELYKLSSSGFEKFTPDGTGTGTWTTLPAAPSTVTPAQNSMVWDGGNYIYVSSSATSSPYTSYLQRFHITNLTWEARTGSLFPRRYAGLAFLNGYIYMLGGLHELSNFSDLCQRYNVATDTWEQIASLPEAANFTKWSTTTDGNDVYHVGSGGGFSGYTISDKVYYYDPATNTWTLESSLPAIRGLAIGLFVPGVYQLFFGGGNDGSSGTAYQVHTWKGEGGPYIPVELVSFSADVTGSGVHLNWMTATEVNNSHFEVERSTDNISFAKIAAVNGNGTTSEPQYYSFVDNNISTGTYYYRLKQVDYDGSFNYSNVVEAEIAIVDFTLHQNYPNPFNPSTKISYQLPAKSFVQIKVYDMLGKEVAVLVNQELDAGSYTVDFDASSLSSGTYIYRLQAGEFNSTRKMVYLK